ncbi:hypothetical protein AAMO2058_001411500 [Amorphochlora amoebiformis]
MSRPDPTGRAAISVSRLLQRNKGYDYKTARKRKYDELAKKRRYLDRQKKRYSNETKQLQEQLERRIQTLEEEADEADIFAIFSKKKEHSKTSNTQKEKGGGGERKTQVGGGQERRGRGGRGRKGRKRAS